MILLKNSSNKKRKKRKLTKGLYIVYKINKEKGKGEKKEVSLLLKAKMLIKKTKNKNGRDNGSETENYAFHLFYL